MKEHQTIIGGTGNFLCLIRGTPPIIFGNTKKFSGDSKNHVGKPKDTSLTTLLQKNFQQLIPKITVHFGRFPSEIFLNVTLRCEHSIDGYVFLGKVQHNSELISTIWDDQNWFC